MKNRYITEYERERQRGGSYGEAIEKALIQLEHDREKWGFKKKQKGIGWRGLFNGLFYEAEVTKNNMAIVARIKDDLRQLRDPNDALAIQGLLRVHIKGLSKSGQTRELISHVLRNVADVNYSTRESSLIKPSPMEILIEQSPPYNDGQRWKEALATILRKKNLPTDIFDKDHGIPIVLGSNIEEHAKWAFNHIYCVPYPHANELREARESDIPRYIHGIQHVSSVAIFVQVFANLYRKHGDKEAMQMSESDVKLLQIAALFHDSARENEGEDLWDHESAVLLYFYLRRVLGVDDAKAKLLAEATANKDPSVANGHFEIKEDSKGEVIWEFNKLSEKQILQKNIFQKIVHDADCLEIIRARAHYDAHYLDFYKGIANKSDNNLALEEMAHLITEARSLIDIRGDSYNRTKQEIKKRYESENAYYLIRDDIHENDHKIVHALGSRLLTIEELKEKQLVDLTPYEKDKGITNQNMRSAIREGRVFARGIATPSAITKKHEDETLAGLEIRKTMREIGISTKSRKILREEKKGNPFRSVSMLGYGSGVFTNAGFLIIDPSIDAISKISTVDSGTGRGKKAHLVALKEIEKRPTKEIIARDLHNLHDKLKTGGETVNFGDQFHKHASNHVEILYDIDQYNAIFYSNDPNLYNVDAFGSSEAKHHFSPILQAIYLQKQYEIQYESTKQEYLRIFGEREGLRKFISRYGDNKSLPICEYSGIHNRIRIVPESELTDEKIIAMWVEMCTDYMKKQLENTDGNDIYPMNINDVKTYSMYTNKINSYAKYNGPADANYPDGLRNKIDAEIEKNKQALIAAHEKILKQKINDGELSIFSNKLFFTLLRSPSLMVAVKDKINSEIEKELNSADLFLNKIMTRFFELKTGYASMDIVESLPTDLNNLTARDQDYKDVLFETKAMRIYALSQQLGFQVPIEKLNNKATELANQAILEIKDELKRQTLLSRGTNPHIKVLHIIKFIDAFNVSSAKFHLEINAILDEIVKQSTHQFINEKIGMVQYSILITNMQKVRFHQPQHIEIVKAAFQKARDGILNSSEGYKSFREIDHYLRLAKLLGENTKEDLIAWFNYNRLENEHMIHRTIGEYDLFFIKTTSECIPLDDNNLDLFQVLITNTSLTQSSLFSSSNDIRYWFNLMEDFQRLTPDKTFSKNQLKIVEDQWSIVCDRYISSVNHSKADIYYNFKDLLYYLKEFLHSNLHLSTDRLAKVFNTNFDVLVNSKELDLAKLVDTSTIDTIIDIHKILPLKEARNDAMEELNRIKAEKQHRIKVQYGGAK